MGGVKKVRRGDELPRLPAFALSHAEFCITNSWPLPALIHWEVKVGGKSMKDVGGAGFAGSSPSFLGRERAAVNVDVGPERRRTN